MKIFDYNDGGIWKGKINFIDTNNVLLGYDMIPSCCESFRWFIINESKKEITEYDLDDYVFDKEYFVSRDVDDDTHEAEFCIVAEGKPKLFIVLYNSHNGYYSHGFNFSKDDVVIQEGSL